MDIAVFASRRRSETRPPSSETVQIPHPKSVAAHVMTDHCYVEIKIAVGLSIGSERRFSAATAVAVQSGRSPSRKRRVLLKEELAAE